MSNIYYAAPLHDKADQERNTEYATRLRSAGHKVYLPQECGIWETMVKERVAEGWNEQDAVEYVRRTLYIADRDAVGRCDFIIAYFGDRAPSEGALWEMGYACGLGKPVYLYNPHYWRFNLMPEFGSMMFDDWDILMDWIDQERFK